MRNKCLVSHPKNHDRLLRLMLIAYNVKWKKKCFKNKQCLRLNGLGCSMEYYDDYSKMMSLNFRYARDFA